MNKTGTIDPDFYRTRDLDGIMSQGDVEAAERILKDCIPIAGKLYQRKGFGKN